MASKVFGELSLTAEFSKFELYVPRMQADFMNRNRNTLPFTAAAPSELDLWFYGWAKPPYDPPDPESSGPVVPKEGQIWPR